MTTLATPDNTTQDPTRRAPLVLGRQDFESVTESVCRLAERPRAPTGWYVAFAVSVGLTGVLLGGCSDADGTPESERPKTG